jgi:hypothetical protein
MEPQQTTAKQLFNEKCCISIPRYQRRYSWREENAHSLIRDIAEVATSGSSAPHWTGVIIYKDLLGADKCQLGEDLNHICREIIDGQQRLTTIRLWLKALLDHARLNGIEIKYGLTPFYLQSPNDAQFQAIIDGKDVAQNDDNISRVYTYFRYILWLGQDALLRSEPIPMPDGRTRGNSSVERWQNWIEKKGKDDEVFKRSEQADCQNLLINTIERFSFLALKLGEQDDAERVFSALNGNRIELSPFDHLRNFVFSKITARTRDQMYQNYWEPAEEEFETLMVKRGVSRDTLKSTFLYDYLISVGAGSLGAFNASRSFGAFRKFERSTQFQQSYGSLDGWVQKFIHDEVALWKVQREEFSRTVLPSGKNLALTASSRRTIHRIRLISDGPPAPLVMLILRRSTMDQNSPKWISPEQVELCLTRLEGYMFKTRLSGKSLTNMRGAVINSMSEIDKSCVTDADGSAADKLLSKIDSWTEVRWSELRHEIANSHRLNPSDGIYGLLGPKGTLALLDCIDGGLMGARSTGFLPRVWEHGADPYWVEHIYPQKDKKWKLDFKEWNVDEATMKSRCHSLGNLTALPRSVNESVSNKRFTLKLPDILENQDAMLSQLQKWTNEIKWTDREIDDRTREMADVLEKLWPDPKLEE